MEYLNLNRQEAREAMNRLGSERTPFVFYTDFLGSNTCIYQISEQDAILYDFGGQSNVAEYEDISPLQLEVIPPTLKEYTVAFEQAIYHLKRGDSYLLNLTFPSRLLTNLNLRQIFQIADAPYKLHIPGKFTVFSPETFIQIDNSFISTYPMKGTIKANILSAKQVLLKNKKELAEHCTIVDLMRNDLSMVSQNVSVDSFRYCERIKTSVGDLIQTSSSIRGQINYEYHSRVGDILYQLLPAGSISGAPKEKTVSIIRNIENSDRGNYTGICGIYDGIRFDSAVMIRYIEEQNDGLYFRSGGGITAQSNLHNEYQELVDKINVPTTGNHSYQQRSHSQSIVS